MAVVSTKAVMAAVTALSLGIISCQKEVSTPAEEQSELASKAGQGAISSTRHERKILFVSRRDNPPGTSANDDEVYAMNLDGTGFVRLTYNRVSDGRATWSANGQHIAFASGAAGSPRDIYIMNANGRGLRNLTNTPTADEEWPEWSPKGNRVIFSSNRANTASTRHDIYVSDLEGDEVIRLTNTPGTDDRWPTYSPDGSRIAFQADFGAPYNTEVMVMDSDGGNIERLTERADLDQMPAWSPDGSQIAFMRRIAGSPDIYVMNADGTDPQPLIATPVFIDARPSWSREGHGLVFMTNRDSNFEIYLLKGSIQNRLTYNPAADDYPFIK